MKNFELNPVLGAQIKNHRSQTKNGISVREYDRQRYHLRRAELVAALGGICTCCGSVEDLAFDHKSPAEKEYSGEELRRKNRWSRLAYYRRMSEQGKIQVLCGACNSSKRDWGNECGCGKGIKRDEATE